MFFLGGDQGWLNAKVSWLGPEIETSRDIYFARAAYPMRGFRWNEFYGRKYFLTNFEFRFPFIDYMVIGWPLQFAIGNIGGVFFTDIGSAWERNVLVGVTPEYEPIIAYDKSFHGGGQGASGGFALDDIKMSFGAGIRMNLGFAVLRFDTAWRTTIEDTEPSPMFNISLGPDF